MAVSDEAVARATGRTRKAWFEILDAYGLDMDHSQRARRLAADHPDLPGWWCQTVVVDFERARGLRLQGQTSAGDFQVSCSKTIPGNVAHVWQRVVTTPFLPGYDWKEGATWDTAEARIEVRRVDAGRMLRWFWLDDGRSTVEVSLQGKGDRTTVTMRHHGLSSPQAVEVHRKRWKAALGQIASADPQARSDRRPPLPPHKAT